nr:major facilitator superfamily domain, general substrate transporter [Tanacetum cinerariifolium]
MFEEYRQREQAANLSTHTPEPSRRFNSICYDDDDDYDYEERTIPLNDIIPQIPPSIESDEFIKSNVEDLVPIPIEFEDTSGSDKYISSDVNPLFDEVLENIKSKDSYDSNLDEPNLLITHLFDANKDDCFHSGSDVDKINDFEEGYYYSEGDILYLKSLLNDDLVHHNPSIPKMSVVSIFEGFIDEPPLEENDDLFDLEFKNEEWKKILYDAQIDDLMSEDTNFDPEICVKFFSPTYDSLPFEDRHYLFFTYVVRILLLYFTYPMVQGLTRNKKRKGKAKIHGTDFNDDPIVTDFMEKIGTKRTRDSGRLMKLKQANGFGNFVEFKVDGIPSKLGLYVVDKFDAKKMEIKSAEGSLKITKNLISEMLGIRNEGIGIMAEEGNINEEMLLREREDEELNSGGFGFGEIEGPFVKQEDPMPDNIEKLNKHVNSIIKEKSGFEKTLDATEYIFPGKLAGFFERYMDALKYQGCRKEGSGNANISDANRATDAQADEQNNEGASFVSVQDMIGEGAISLGDEHADIGMDQEGTVDDNKFGSPTLYNMGPETQTLANELVDKLSNEKRFGSPTLYNMGPETQEEDVVTPVTTTHKSNLASEISNPVPLRPIPLRVCPPGTAVGRLRRDIDKRPVTISKVRKSPFIGRVVDADGSLNAEEKGSQNTCLKFDNGGHKFLFVVDPKNSRPLLIDHEKNEKIVRKRVKKKIRTRENLTVASMLQEDFRQYLMVKNHKKAGNFIGSEIEVREFDWQTNSMETEAGIFVMWHMETCMGMGMDELNCCLAGTTRKQKNNFF